MSYIDDVKFSLKKATVARYSQQLLVSEGLFAAEEPFLAA